MNLQVSNLCSDQMHRPITLQVEQLSEYGDEECMFLTASLTDGTLSYIGSKYGHSFLTKYKNIKGNFLKFCLESKFFTTPKCLFILPSYLPFKAACPQMSQNILLYIFQENQI
jgi:hypothetical protein